MNILLADGRPRVRSALRILLEQQLEWQVVAEAGSASELLDLAELRCPDLVLLDSELPGIQDGHTLGSIRSLCPEVRIVALVEPQPPRHRPASLSADAYATKVHSPEVLLGIIRKCLEIREPR